MSFRLFTISTMYAGSLKAFYEEKGVLSELSYTEHFESLMQSTTEFAGSYYTNFKKLGIDAGSVIANDHLLQKKWLDESETSDSDKKNILFNQTRKFMPDVLWIDNLSITDVSWLKEIRIEVPSIKLIIAYHCSPIKDNFKDKLKYIDFVLTCTPGLKQDLERMGSRSYLVYHAFDQKILDRLNLSEYNFEHGLIFSGSLSTGKGYHGERLELIEKFIRSDVDISLYADLENPFKICAKQALYFTNRFLERLMIDKLKKYIPALQHGREITRPYSKKLKKLAQQPVFGSNMFQLLRDSRVVLNSHGDVAGDYAGNMRLFEATGTGACLLTDNKLNISELFEPGKEIVVYDNIEDCIEKAKWLLNNDVERRVIANAGSCRTLASHTVDKRCLQIIEIIESELASKE